MSGSVALLSWIPGTALAIYRYAVNIRFTSTLTSEDENLVAPAVLKAFTELLDLLPIAYAIQIDTSDSQVYLHTRTDGHTPAADSKKDVKELAAVISRHLDAGV